MPQKGPCMWEQWVSRATSCQRATQSHIVWREHPFSPLKEATFSEVTDKQVLAASLTHSPINRIGPWVERKPMFDCFVSFSETTDISEKGLCQGTGSTAWLQHCVCVGITQSQVPRPPPAEHKPLGESVYFWLKTKIIVLLANPVTELQYHETVFICVWNFSCTLFKMQTNCLCVSFCLLGCQQCGKQCSSLMSAYHATSTDDFQSLCYIDRSSLVKTHTAWYMKHKICIEQAWTVIQNVIQLNGGILHIELTYHNIVGFVGGKYFQLLHHHSTR